jgi:Lar family restriction alleviation protein
MKREFKHCPFCGDAVSMFVELIDHEFAAVICDECGARGPEIGRSDYEYDYESESAARGAWNQRAAPVQQEPAPEMGDPVWVTLVSGEILAALPVPTEPDSEWAAHDAVLSLADERRVRELEAEVARLRAALADSHTGEG